MNDMIRSGNAGRCALALVMLFGSLAICRAQESAAPAPTAGQEAAKQDAPAQGAKDDATTAKPATASQQDTSPAATVPPPPPATAPAAGQPAPKGKSSSKKGKNSAPTTPNGPGEVTDIGVQSKPYVIGPQDVLFLNVLHQPDVSGSLEVGPDGYVSVRFAGRLKAAGLTVEQLSTVVADKLTAYFNHPEVIIQVSRINSKKYYIAGEVHRPGAYPLTAPKTIYEALIEAGGPAEFAKSTKIYILRGQEKIPFNYKDVSKGKNLRQNVLLENGDVIQVP